MIQDQLNALEQAGFFWTHDVADADMPTISISIRAIIMYL